MIRHISLSSLGDKGLWKLESLISYEEYKHMQIYYFSLPSSDVTFTVVRTFSTFVSSQHCGSNMWFQVYFYNSGFKMFRKVLSGGGGAGRRG